MKRLPKALLAAHPCVVKQDCLPYQSASQFFVHPCDLNGGWVFMRGSTWCRYRNSGYWWRVWVRFARFNRITIFSKETVIDLMARFTRLADLHISRRPRYAQHIRPAVIDEPYMRGVRWLPLFGFDGFFFAEDRYAYVNGELLRFDSLPKRRLAKALANEYERGQGKRKKEKQ